MRLTYSKTVSLPYFPQKLKFYTNLKHLGLNYNKNMNLKTESVNSLRH